MGFGTAMNGAVLVARLGTLVRARLPQRMREMAMWAIGTVTFLIGVSTSCVCGNLKCGGDMELLDANITLFVAASLAIIIAPGPDNIYVLTRGVAQGRQVALASAWGMCSGLLFHTTLATLGLSAILARSAVAFSMVKYAGAAYLIYLGVRALLSNEEFATSPAEAPAARFRSFFLRGLTMNLLNPKVAVFFLAFLPQFASPAADGVTLRLVALGLLFALLSVVVFSTIAIFSGALGNRLSKNPRFANALQWLTGCVLVGLGVRLVLSGRG